MLPQELKKELSFFNFLNLFFSYYRALPGCSAFIFSFFSKIPYFIFSVFSSITICLCKSLILLLYFLLFSELRFFYYFLALERCPAGADSNARNFLKNNLRVFLDVPRGPGIPFFYLSFLKVF